MKQFFLKIASSILALLVLFSTFSFTVEKHYCGEFLMDVSFTGEAKDCGMKMEAKTPTKKKNCCKDEIHQIDGQDELQNYKVEIFTFENQQFLTALFISYKDLFIINESKKTYFKDLSPPDIPLDYQIFYQSF